MGAKLIFCTADDKPRCKRYDLINYLSRNSSQTSTSGILEQKNNLALDQLKQKETRLLKRLHLSEHYPKYLPADLQNTENLMSWCNLLSRRSAFDLGDTRLTIQKLEEKQAGLAGQIQYWEGVLR